MKRILYTISIVVTSVYPVGHKALYRLIEENKGAATALLAEKSNITTQISTRYEANKTTTNYSRKCSTQGALDALKNYERINSALEIERMKAAGGSGFMIGCIGPVVQKCTGGKITHKQAIIATAMTAFVAHLIQMHRLGTIQKFTLRVEPYTEFFLGLNRLFEACGAAAAAAGSYAGIAYMMDFLRN